MAIPYHVQKKEVITLLTVKHRLTWNCLVKKLGFKPDIQQLVQDKVIRLNPRTKQYELIPESATE